MKLRTIAISVYGHPREISVPISFETRALCNYVQRFARTLKIETQGFNQIVVHDDPFRPDLTAPRVVPEKTLEVPFKFDVVRYKGAVEAEKQRYFCEVLREGLRCVISSQDLRLEPLWDRIDEFERGGYQNRWIHQSKNLRGSGLVAELHCELSAEAFNLTLAICKKTGTVTTINVLTTKPDEICFHYKFKDIELREDHLVITNRMYQNDELVRFPLSMFTSSSDA